MEEKYFHRFGLMVALNEKLWFNKKEKKKHIICQLLMFAYLKIIAIAMI